MTKPAATVAVRFRLNDTPHALRVAAATTLVDLLRDALGQTGTKIGCGVGECGACTVLLDDAPVLACLVLAAEVDGRRVTTIEARGDTRLEQLREAFLVEGALQCGFCTPGMILAARPLLPDADAATIRTALVGNLCRCTGYAAIVRAVQRAGRRPPRRRTRARRG